MIRFVRGELAGVEDDAAIIDVGGIGYRVFISLIDEDLLPQVGSEVMLHTYTNVKEDEITLYGFLNPKDRYVFSQLITVSGVGPKGAMSIISTLSTDDLIFAIAANDSKTISKANGIGTKTAQKICIDLKDKLKLEDSDVVINVLGTKDTDESTTKGQINIMRNEVYQSLEALGFSSKEIMPVLKKININENSDIEDIISEALRLMNK